MPAHISRIYPRDEELGKRDDNYRPAKGNSPAWLTTATRWRRKRLVYVLLGVVAIYLFIRNMPRDLGSIDQRMGRALRPGHEVGGATFGYTGSSGRGSTLGGKSGLGSPQEPTGPPPKSAPASKSRNKAVDGQEEHYYSGPIKFYRLAASLNGISKTMGHRLTNRNVLFAASNLKSAANLIPMACEMARWERNYVHFILLGRQAVPLHDVLEVNGVKKESCKVYFHDGRADYSEYSTDVRAEVAVAGALKHVNQYMHPQAVVIDDSAVEDAFFIRGVRGKMKEMGKPVIEVPKGKYTDFLWMTRLDSDSLSSWHKPNIDILVHVPPNASGGLIRLLKSLSAADYAGLPQPRLTIELPSNIDRFLHDYIRWLQWPPGTDSQIPHLDGLKLHHRISTSQSSSEASSIRFLESFYPSNSGDSHVLVLSSQAEVSERYYQYLIYTLLEHRYSSLPMGREKEHTYGISLSAPKTQLNGKDPFKLPSTDEIITDRSKLDPDVDLGTAPFYWSAPNADASLIFGDRWVEFHNYLSNRLRATHDFKSSKKPAKLVSQSQPSWTEFLLELVRARSWTLLMPAQSTSAKWVTVHKELYQVPEEFRQIRSKDKTKQTQDEDAKQARQIEEPFLLAETTPAAADLPSEDKNALTHEQPLHALMPFDGDWPDSSELPLFSYDGARTNLDDLLEQASLYTQTLREKVGGCDATEAQLERIIQPGLTQDLFCFAEDRDQLETVDQAVRELMVVAEELERERANDVVGELRGQSKGDVGAGGSGGVAGAGGGGGGVVVADTKPVDKGGGTKGLPAVGKASE